MLLVLTEPILLFSVDSSGVGDSVVEVVIMLADPDVVRETGVVADWLSTPDEATDVPECIGKR